LLKTFIDSEILFGIRAYLSGKLVKSYPCILRSNNAGLGGRFFDEGISSLWFLKEAAFNIP